MDKSVIILQARAGSSRLPRKMILPFFEKESVLEVLLNRIKKDIPETALVVATTTEMQDDEIAVLCKQLNVFCYRGSESDVLDRFISAAKSVSASKIIRVCADNLFLDMISLKQLIVNFEKKDVDYMSYCTSSGTPSIKTHYGLWGEAVKLAALEKVASLTNDMLYREHVTNYIYSHLDQFTVFYLPIDSFVESHLQLRLTVDTLSDFEIQQKIYKELVAHKKEISVENVINYVDENCELYELMDANIRKNSK